MKIHTLFIFVLVTFHSIGQDFRESRLPHVHLSEVNQEWLEKKPVQDQLIAFASEEDRISYHLLQVIERLRSVDAEQVLSHEKRHRLLSELERYALNKEFPKNIYHAKRTPYFIDHEGTACAVGHLMIQSGQAELASLIQSQHNYDYIRDIRTEGVLEWAQENGFGLEELAWIQPTYAPNNTLQVVDGGVNGPVNDIEGRSYYNRLYLTGVFDSINGDTPCPEGIAYVENGALHCIDDAPNGEVLDMTNGSNESVVFTGGLSFNGQEFPVAIYDEDEWAFISIPERPNAIGKAIEWNNFSHHRIVLAIDPQDGSGNNEIWRFDTSQDSIWHLLVTTLGEINCEARSPYRRFGGNFSSYIDHLDNDQEVESDGIVGLSLSSFFSNYTTPYTSEYLPDNIQAIISSGNSMFVAGTGDSEYPNHLLTRYQNKVYTPLYSSSSPDFVNNGIYDIGVYSESQILIAGDIGTGNNSTFGHGLGLYDVLTGYISPVAWLDTTVRCIHEWDDVWYIGGDFTENISSPLPHFARIGLSSSLVEHERVKLNLYPNPTTDFISVVSLSEPGMYRIHDSKGTLLMSGVYQSNQRIDVRKLETGYYILSVNTESKQGATQFLKE